MLSHRIIAKLLNKKIRIQAEGIVSITKDTVKFRVSENPLQTAT